LDFVEKNPKIFFWFGEQGFLNGKQFFDSPDFDIKSLTPMSKAKILGKWFVKKTYFSLKTAVKRSQAK